MKKIICILISILSISCLKDEKDLFDKSSAERMKEAIKEVNNILVENEKDWLFEYFPNASNYGGFNLFVVFKDNEEVLITKGENVSGIYAESDLSLFGVKADESLVLSFDTFNKVLHAFGDEHELAWEADYEFLISKYNSNLLELIGRKKYSKSRLIVIDEGIDSYKEKINSMIELLTSPGYSLVIDNISLDITLNKNYHFMVIENGSESINAPYIYTTEGICFHDTLEVLGQKLYEFSFENGALLSKNGNAKIELIYIPENETFLNENAWYFNSAEGMMSDLFREEWDKLGGEVNYIYLGKTTDGDQAVFSRNLWTNNQNYLVNLESVFTAVEGTTDQVEIYFTGDMNGNYPESMYRLANYVYFHGMISNTDPEEPGKIFSISRRDGEENIVYLTFTDVENPDNWFTLVDTEILWPNRD